MPLQYNGKNTILAKNLQKMQQSKKNIYGMIF